MSVYLDNAATSFPKPESVYSAADDFMRHNGAAFGRGAHSAGSQASQIVAQCRHRLAQILDVESDDRVAFTFNCTDSLNLLLRGVLNRGDHVVTTTLEHNSVLRPLHQLQNEWDLNVTHVDFDVETGMVDPDKLAVELSTSKPRLVVINHASNVTGTIQPVKAMINIAHEAGALVLLDAAQTAGHVPFSVRDLNVDLLATAGHKGLLGPLGTGLIYIKDGLTNEVASVRCGGTGTASESITQPTEMPSKFESGNLNMPGLAGLNAAAEWLLQSDANQVHRQVARHTESLMNGLREIPEITLHSQQGESNVGIVSFNIGAVDCREVATILDDSFQVQCRAGLHCAPLVHRTLKTLDTGGTVRLSPGVFTTEGDIDIAIHAVSQIAQAFAG